MHHQVIYIFAYRFDFNVFLHAKISSLHKKYHINNIKTRLLLKKIM